MSLLSPRLVACRCRRHGGPYALITLSFVMFSGLLGCLTGAGGGNQMVILDSSEGSVRAGETATFSATQRGVNATGGTWAVFGGTSNGSIDAKGIFSAPATVPVPNNVTVAYTLDGSTTTAAVNILNPMPVITSATPSIVTASPTPITLVGIGFVPGSVIRVNSLPIATTFVDSSHLTGTLVPSASTPSVQLAVSNSDPGGSTSPAFVISETALNFTVSPSVLNGGSVSLTLTGTGFPAKSVVLIDGKPITTTSQTATNITATGFLSPWKTGSTVIGVAASPTTGAVGVQTVPIAATPVTFDTAARFSTQAAWGPRPDVVSHIQQIGLDAYITEQLGLPGVTYDPAAAARTQYLRAIQTGNSLLRLRVAWALQSFLVSQGTFFQPSVMPYETKLERDATGNFRTLMTDVADDQSMGQFLSLAGNNFWPWDPIRPNQNFGRELMQLFTLGSNLLNDDGTLQLDSLGNPIPTYTQDQVVDLSRVFTGWNLNTPANPAYTSLQIDYSQVLAPIDGWHDHGSKTIVGSVVIPAGLGIIDDRTMALDTIFQHPNLPPHVSRILIQRLVKSQPSHAYIQRISRVFENDGTGVRGNLSAVVRAILLDPEARAGDAVPASDDGYLQEPLLWQIFATGVTELPISDDQPDYICNDLGQPWWYSNTVFGYFSPDNMIPGTKINSPEFQLFNNQTVTMRSEYLWGLLTGTMPGYSSNNSSWLYTNFKTVPDLLDALDHLAFHGQMPAAEKAAIIAYCQQLAQQDIGTQFQSALFLALNSDSFAVSH
jgi:Protein of unknown function (DUF1800)